VRPVIDLWQGQGGPDLNRTRWLPFIGKAVACPADELRTTKAVQARFKRQRAL